VTLVFSWVRRDPGGTDFALQLTQDVVAEASFVLLCLVLMLGPAERFMPRLRRDLLWAREFGEHQPRIVPKPRHLSLLRSALGLWLLPYGSAQSRVYLTGID
jgi:hypothetical protein